MKSNIFWGLQREVQEIRGLYSAQLTGEPPSHLSLELQRKQTAITAQAYYQ